ncbi:M23 family metallopeptidase [Agathobaculum sp.]|uniref:M23 family metallopeptidase n=1 Tax=Agathobaculum sp. TaxID=2048138 RepID=UPI0027B9B005|nr:peptidoglycan DD-metalloendopeptidase family protein [Agathobaculum sp.]
MARNRWELEENRKKKEQEKARQSIQNAAKTQRQAWQEGAATRRKANSSSGSTGNSAARTGTTTASTQKSGLSGLRNMDSFNQQLTQNATTRREAELAGGAAQRRTNIDSRTGTNLSRYNQDMAQLQENQIRWHTTDDPAERKRLNEENNAIRQRRGLSYDAHTGVTYDSETGRNYSAPTQAAFGSTAMDRIRNANNWRQSREFFGMDEDDTTMLPTVRQIQQSGSVEAARGINAHQVLNELYSRGAETWTDTDTVARDQAVQALSDEMKMILEQYGLQYNARETGPNARFFVSDSEAIERLRQAGADETTIAYVQENINQREAADRLGQGAEAVIKRAVGSIPALFETGQQQAANVEESRKDPEYVQLEEQERQLESQLYSMPSTNYDGSVNQEYAEIYNELQRVRERKDQLAVNTPVDQSRWGQTMLREAAEAQTNATAGLSAVPRFLVNTGISIAGNAPVMATSLIPGAGPAVGAALIGASAAGQRAQELSAEGAAPSEALGRGTLSGIIEAVTEKLPLDTLADILQRGGTGAVRSILRQMGVEAGEESASYLMNYAADLAAADPNAQFSFAELAQNALGGAISGGVFGAAGTLGGRVRTGAQTAQETAAATQVGNNAPMAQETTQDIQTPVQSSPQMTSLEARAAAARARNAPLQVSAWPEGARRPRLEGGEEFLDDAAIPESDFRADSQALGRRLAELDEQRRTAENLLPGPARDARIAEIEAEMEQVRTTAPRQTTMRDFQQQRQAQAARDFAAAGEPVQAEQPAAPEVNVPVPEAVQYGATPQQAMREAEVRAQGEAAQEAARSEREETVSGLMQAWTDKRAAEAQAERTREGLTLTDNDIRLAQNAAASGVDSVNWEYADNPEKAMLYGRTLRAVREADQPIRQFFAQRATAMQSEAQHAADAIATYAKDKRFGGQYQRETMERNIRDIFGKDHQTEAEAIIREYITPVHKAVAEGNKLKNSMRERVKALKLNKHERALVQMRLEAEDGAAAEYIKNNKIKVTPEMDAKISRAVEEFRSIYNELYNRINETLLLNGQEPAAFRKNYAPHFTKDKPDTVLGRIRFALGLGKDSSLNIPTDIAGLTDTFRPGKKWFGNLLQREGEITDYDAVAGFDQYIENATDVITLTESIQKLRVLEDQVRYTLSDEGVQAQIDAIRANPELDALQQREQMEKVYDTNRTTVQQLIDDLRNQQRMGMGRFVTELRRYTDNLAGKKSREDRGWEDMANRQVYQLAKSLEGRVAANMISLNPGSWLTNIIPITQATGEVSVPNLVRGMFQTVKANIKDDGYRDASAFLTNRYGSESIDKTIGRRVSDLSGAPMELIDHFTANTIHRARYAQNIDRGMSMDEAIDDADAYTASLMADRSKGALPTAFNATNPIRKVFTMFQTEVNNQLSYLFKDMPRAQRQKGVAAVAWAYTKVFGTAYLFNLAYSQLTGRDSAFDPIGMIADALGVGDDEDDERTVAERLTGLAEDIGGNIPFVGGVLFDGGRVPISSAIPNFANLGKAIAPELFGVEWSGDKRAQTALKEIAKPLTYLVPPFGGGAAKRAIEGFATVNAGGSYTYDNEGNRTLQFPTYGQTPLDYARAMLFGKWSSEEAQEYIDNGFKGLSADETAVFDQLRNSMGLDARQAMDTILGLRGYETVRDEDGKILQTVKDQQRLALFENDNLTPEQKAAIDRALIVSGEDEQPADYTDRNAFLIGQYVSESRQDAAREAISHGLDIDQFVQWDDRLRELENEKGADDKAVRSAAEARVMLLDEVMQDGALSDGEKQTIADYIVISSMGDSQREDWESIAKGKVSASDYVQFVGDVSAYKEEYKNTGADNSANVAEILRGYDGLTDAQRDVLFQTYSDTMKNNPFHVSEYEQRMQGNQFYQDLNEAGRAEVRALANEYEQDINEDNELSDWEGKAYMAKEAGISPETYILYRVALAATNEDGKGSAKQSEAETAVNLIPGLTQQQKAYLYQSTNTSWKNNPFGSATVTKYNAETTEAINPVEGGTLSSSFGPRSSPTAGASSWHKAVDIAASAGTPVKSVMPGTVVAVNKSGYGGGYGVSVRVDHGNGVITEYHHMQEGSADNINVGDTVEAGQQIGKVGSTGISTGPHLDMQAWKDGQIVDPLTIIPGYGDPSGYVYDGTVSSGVVSSGSSGSSSGSSGKSSGSGSSRSSGNGLSTLKGLSGLKKLG